jgi:hypothetical protein
LTSNTIFGYGVAVSTSKRFCLGLYATHDQTSTNQDSMRYKSAAACIVSYAGGEGASYDGLADFVSWDTNGCTINWSNAPGSAYLMTVIFFCGTDLSVDISTLAINTSVDGTVTESGLSFQPDVLIPAFEGWGAWSVGGDYWFSTGLGFVKNGGNKTALLANVPSYNPSCKSVGRLTTAYGCGMANYQTDGSVFNGYEFGSFGAAGFTVTTRLNAVYAASDMKILCLKFGTYSSYVGSFASKTSTGTQAYTGVGFKPQALIGIFTSMTAVDSSDTGHGHGFFCSDNNKDTGIHEFNSGNMGGSNSYEKSYYNSKLNCHRADTGAKLVEATMSSYDSDGFTLNYTTADGTARYGIYFAVQEAVDYTTNDQRAIGRGIGRGISRGIG